MSVAIKSKLRILTCQKHGARCTETERRKKKIATTFMKTEKQVLDILNSYIHNMKDPTCVNLSHDVQGYSALHLAAKRNFLPVAEKLLECGFDPLTPACNESKQLALHVAIEKGYDDMGALLIRHIVPADVRELFLTDAKNTGFKDCKHTRKYSTPPEKTVDVLSLNYLINSDVTFVKTIQAVFDHLKDIDDSGFATVYVKLLEEDDSGLEPTEEGFNDHFHTVFHNLIKAQNEVTNHPVIGTLIDHKWNAWGRRRFALNFLLYLVSLFSLTFSVGTAVMTDDVQRYDTSLQRARAFFEITLCIISFHGIVTEVWQMKRHMLEYWKQFHNWIELLSSSSIFLVLILRFATENAHWFVLAVAYVLWILRIFKYAAVSRQTGAYAESLRQILTRNFVPFSLLFIVVNVAFSGVFLLVLKGEGSLNTHNETSTMLGILFVGLRTMIEAQPIVEYAGSDGYGTAGIIVMLVFLSMTIVVLLNILIAQLSDTYSKIQGDAVKSVRANRIAILTRLERNERQVLSYIKENLSRCRCTAWLMSLCTRSVPVNWKSISVGNRKKYYKSVFENIDLKHQHQSYTTLMEDMDERIHELRRLQIKTDLKAQTVKSKLRQLDVKIDKNFLEIKDLLKMKYISDNEIHSISESEMN